jgi:hypothetical protein
MSFQHPSYRWRKFFGLPSEGLGFTTLNLIDFFCACFFDLLLLLQVMMQGGGGNGFLCHFKLA